MLCIDVVQIQARKHFFNPINICLKSYVCPLYYSVSSTDLATAEVPTGASTLAQLPKREERT